MGVCCGCYVGRGVYVVGLWVECVWVLVRVWVIVLCTVGCGLGGVVGGVGVEGGGGGGAGGGGGEVLRRVGGG